MHQMLIHISNALEAICKIEKDIFSVWGMFKRTSFNTYAERLTIQLVALESIADTISTIEDQRKTIVLDYIIKLYKSTKHLRYICERLEQKSTGKQYDKAEYSQDLELFRYLQNEYMDAGTQMNRLLSSL